MTNHATNQTNIDSRLKEIEEENELLLLQFRQAQEELERCHLINQQLEKNQATAVQSSTTISGWVEDELPDVLAENQRLLALLEAQQKVYRLETENALNNKLGNILIQGVDSPISFFSIPGKLGKIWLQSRKQLPPSSLGGKDFAKLIAAYNEGGFTSTEKLMAGISISPAMQANGYTVLARKLMTSDPINAAEAARRAYTLDPRPYRLKWLAFKLHEAGNVVEAEAILDVLPPEISFTDSEARQANRLRKEAKRARQREAKQKTGFSERRGEIEKQLTKLKQERDRQTKLLTDRGREIELLKQAKVKELELLKQAKEKEIALLKLAQEKLTQESSVLAAQQLSLIHI